MAPTEWVVLLQPTGRVVAVGGGAPREWTGGGLDEPSPMPPAVREAGRVVVQRLVADPVLSLAEARLPAGAPHPAVLVLAARAVPIRLRLVDPVAVLSETLQPLRQQAQVREVSFDLSVTPGLPRSVLLDAEKIAWCVTTLVGNALRFVRQGTRRRPGGEVRVLLDHDRVAGVIEISVFDDGAGIAAERAARIFEPGPLSGLGSGLALPLVREVVIAHGGSVHLTTSTDPVRHGTTVTLRLPAGSARSPR